MPQAVASLWVARLANKTSVLEGEEGVVSLTGPASVFALPRRSTLYIYTGPASKVCKYTHLENLKKDRPGATSVLKKNVD